MCIWNKYKLAKYFVKNKKLCRVSYTAKNKKERRGESTNEIKNRFNEDFDKGIRIKCKVFVMKI